MTAAYADGGWAKAALLPADREPVDEGPGLEPIRRKDFANIAVPLAPALRPACSTAALAGRIRASMLFADPLQAALDRPNREIVTPSRNGAATTLQALELTNGATLADALSAARKTIAARRRRRLMHRPALPRRARSRPDRSRRTSRRARSARRTTQPRGGVTDLLWALVMLPEFQLID